MSANSIVALCLQLLARVGADLHDMNEPGVMLAFSLARTVTPDGLPPYGSTWYTAAAECAATANVLHKEHWALADLDGDGKPLPDYALATALQAYAMAYACSALAVASERWAVSDLLRSHGAAPTGSDAVEALYVMARAYEQRAEDVAACLQARAQERAAERKANKASKAKPKKAKKRKGAKR